MPSKLDDSSNLQFLYVCLESGPQKRIDFQEVAKVFGLSVPAARMRWRRLQVSLGGDKQDGKVTKPKSAALNRKTKRVGEKSGMKEGLEVNWKGGKDGDNDDDDEEEITSGKVERRRSGSLKKEESDDDQLWKTLPEAAYPRNSGEEPSQAWKTLAETAYPSTSAEEHSQTTMPSPPFAPMHHGPLETQTYTVLRNASLPVPNTVSFEETGDFLLPLDAHVYSSAHVALPQTQDGQTFPESYQPNYPQ